jgi:hypothetical protein
MSKLSDWAENKLLALLLQNIDWTNIGDAGGLLGSVADGNLYAALHTADPGDAGSQVTSEIAYTGYARVAIARSAVGWDVTANEGSNAATILFPKMTGGAGGTATWITIGQNASGAGEYIVRAEISSPVGGILVSVGITPEIEANALTIETD